MAGMIPGVGVASRRKMQYYHHRQDHPSDHLEPSFRERLGPSITSMSTMNETALRARQRLEHKLGYFRSSSGSRTKRQPDEGRGRNHKEHKKVLGLSSKLLGKAWHYQLSRCKSGKKVCAVCLEDFEADEEIMNLPCSHKYHSNCLVPWLAVQPHCPYCRTPVQS